ncbi:hypothetical protein [Yersinia proxima]|uniref:hypothetical protein n=1 Tax=Yersinia proxima TaxID=2890316 RepID=UPI0005E03416|nr:hypothetical protein [Yersinia proxima]CNK87785.1 Uncharacterised protein [Yersinia intermedia]
MSRMVLAQYVGERTWFLEDSPIWVAIEIHLTALTYLLFIFQVADVLAALAHPNYLPM